MRRRFRKIRETILREQPSVVGNLFIGVYQIALGIWLFLPFDSFGPTLHFGPPPPTVEAETIAETLGQFSQGLFNILTEESFAGVMVLLGILQIMFSVHHRWDQLMHLSIWAAMFWAFVSMGYILTLPTSTSIITFSLLTIYFGAKYIYLKHWEKKNLPNNKKVGNI